MMADTGRGHNARLASRSLHPAGVASTAIGSQRGRAIALCSRPGTRLAIGAGMSRSATSLLDRLIPTPRLVEMDSAELAAPPERVWELLRHGNLARSPLVRSLFALRALPDRLRGKVEPMMMRIDDLVSSEARPGFQVLGDDPPHEVAVGAIGKVWLPNIPFVHVADAEHYATFDEPDYAKVAWAIRVLPYGERDSRIEFEVRVDTTDAEAYPKFRRYFRLIGPGSHFIRRSLLAALERELGTPRSQEDSRPLAGDERLPDAAAHVTEGITIAAPPERIWPWLVQIGCQRAGFYSIDWLDNGGEPSARELHPELQRLSVGQVIPASPDSDEGFEVLEIDAPHTLLFGGLFDPVAGHQLPFHAQRPKKYWQITWSFVLEALDANSTRLHVRARAAFSPDQRLHVAWIRPVHHLMQRAMLRHLAERVEGRQPRDDLHEVLRGLGGASIMLGAWLSPFMRPARSHWGLDLETAQRRYPGDDLVETPSWSWTHGVEIAAPAERVWPWVAQIGADRAGFYSYQWLENLVGCNVHNAETVHPQWHARVGDALLLHPDPHAPRLIIGALEPGRFLLARSHPDAGSEFPRARVSWLLQVEPLGPDCCHFISRFRVAHSDDLQARWAFGPALLEPVGFAMDRQMLLGVKRLAERC